jgi:two-component system chemotaxis response regulator CheB
MSEVKVIRHRRRFQPEPPPAPLAAPEVPVHTAAAPEIVGVVSSTGGPAALHAMLRVLPADFCLPIVIVQHIAPDFTDALLDWLGRVISLPVMEAQPYETPRPGTVYLAPGGSHLTLTTGRRFAQVDEPRNHPHIPSGDVLLESLARGYGRMGSASC